MEKSQHHQKKFPCVRFPMIRDREKRYVHILKILPPGIPVSPEKMHGISIGIDIFRETGYLLSGHLDAIRHSLDSSTKQELASKPVVDFLETLLFNAILTGCQERDIPLVQKSSWPEGKKFAVCLTHDIDEIKKTYQWISHPGRCLSQERFFRI